MKELKDNIKLLREITNPSDAAMVMLASVAEMFERAVTFFVRPSELIGERAIGVSSEKSMGPTPADRLKIPLSKPSVFRDVLEKGLAYYGESSDEALKELFKEIGKPLSPAVVLLPLICDRKVVAVDIRGFREERGIPGAARYARDPCPAGRALFWNMRFSADRWRKRLKNHRQVNLAGLRLDDDRTRP